MHTFNARFADGLLRLEMSTGEGSGYAIEMNEAKTISLYSWPLYGGGERFENTFNTIQEAISEAESWT